ncbi:waprin-Thr1 [Athalia rosae]|uniref:waprin-Thr1 n=1 Tax=Athalia rosae TaxID=37344 RepID=UPI0020340410|nr:waprin-Thr1 [Athalia rosae]
MAHPKAALLLIASMLITFSAAQLSFKSGNCPLRDTNSKCMPSCSTDYQCSGGDKCCPNKCGFKSCVSPSAVSTGGDGGYKGSSDSGVYCAGVKCGRYEKCQFDRSTKREKCVRT